MLCRFDVWSVWGPVGLRLRGLGLIRLPSLCCSVLSLIVYVIIYIHKAGSTVWFFFSIKLTIQYPL